MARYMLDTDTCSYIMKRSHPLVLKRLQSVRVGDVCMSVVSRAELLYGVEVSPRRAQDAAALAAFLPYVEVVTLDATRRFLKVQRPISLTRGDKRIALYPSDHFKVTYSIAFDHPLLRHQSRTIRISEASFIEEIAAARTFTFLKDVEMLRQNGLALGGSLDNAIVLGETGVLNNALRFEDEFVRHKILDAVGDLALVGYPVIGHLVAHRAGHALHTEFASKILEETHAWRLVEAPADGVALPMGLPVKSGAPRLAS